MAIANKFNMERISSRCFSISAFKSGLVIITGFTPEVKVFGKLREETQYGLQQY